ncbi:hypothetical protein LXL04_016040 [Taraxacum kok-saghyz]
MVAGGGALALHSYYIAGITDRSLTRVHVCVVTEIEGSIPGDTAAITSSQLRRSNRGPQLTTHN